MIDDPATASDHDSQGNSMEDNTNHHNHNHSSINASVIASTTTSRAISDNESALQLALEASRSEAGALKLAVKHATDRYNDLKETHDALLEQLKQDVSEDVGGRWECVDS